MLANHRETVDKILANHVTGRSLPGEMYGGNEVFEVDLDVFFKKHWIVVGVTCDVPEAGDVYTVDIDKASVILVRDEDEEIKAYRNVCRHRGSRLKPPGKSTVGMLVCPYHQWTYALDGALSRASNMGEGFDKTCKSLASVPVKVVGAHILICLSDNPPEDISVFEEALGERFKPYDLKNTKIAFETEIIENGNWKQVIENNRECYHCAGSHPELNLSFRPEDFGTEGNPASILKQEDWEKDGHQYEAIEYLEEGNVTQFRTQRLIIGGAGESQTMDTKVACTKLLGKLDRRDLGDTHMWTHSSWTHVMSDHAVISYLIPISPGKTVVRSKWLVRADAVEGVDYNIDNLTEVWKATNQQDANLVGISYSGTQDPAYIPGEYSKLVESYVEQFVRWYTTRLQAHGFGLQTTKTIALP